MNDEYCHSKQAEKRGAMNTWEKEQREWEIKKELEEIESGQRDCDDLERELASLEEEMYWENKQIKEMNDDLFVSYPKNRELQNLLLEKEELLQQKLSFEKLFFEECRDSINEYRKNAEARKEDCEEELLSLNKEEGEEQDENYFYTDADKEGTIL